MRHPTDGALRRLVDEPAGVADADREHVADCPVCLAGLVAARDDAAEAEGAVAVEVAVDVEAAWQRLSGALAADARPPAPVRRRRRFGLRSPVIAAVGVAALLAGAGAAAAADWLQIFRPERVAPISVTRDELVNLPELEAYGDVAWTDRSDVRDVAGAVAAEQATGIPVPRVGELPRGVTGEPAYQVRDHQSVVFTFRAAKAAASAAAAGRALPAPPPGLDGSRFRMSWGPRLTAVWSEGHGVPALVVSRAVAPTVESSGAPFALARDYVLSLPGVPAALAGQLRDISADGTTLPLRVLSDRMTSSPADVDGV